MSYSLLSPLDVYMFRLWTPLEIGFYLCFETPQYTRINLGRKRWTLWSLWILTTQDITNAIDAAVTERSPDVQTEPLHDLKNNCPEIHNLFNFQAKEQSM